MASVDTEKRHFSGNQLKKNDTLAVTSMSSIGVIGLSLMRKAVFDDDSREYVDEARLFLTIMIMDLGDCIHPKRRQRRLSQTELPISASVEQKRIEIIRSGYDPRDIFSSAGVNLRDRTGLEQLRQQVQIAGDKVGDLLDGVKNPELAGDIWIQLREWHRWYSNDSRRLTR